MTEQKIVQIRPMSVSDLDQVMAIELVSFQSPWKREHFIQEVHSHLSFPFVAVAGGAIAGYLCLMSLFEEAQILNITVSPEQQRKGVARMLMEQALATSREKGAENLVLEVRESNLAAIGLYESFGFVRYFVRKGYYDGKEDAIMMERLLVP